MLNLFRMDLYRMIKAKSFLVILVLSALISLGSTPAEWALYQLSRLIAEKLGVSCSWISCILRKELSPEMKEKVFSIIRELAEAGAFADNAGSTYESASTDLFLNRQAAMQLDGSWLTFSFSPDMMKTIAVLPMPLRNGGGAADCYIGGVSMGFYLTRRAWESARRDAAVSLLAALTSEESIRRLGNTPVSGLLLETSEALRKDRNMIGPLQDAMNSRAREVWLLDCIPAVAEGTMTPEECWRRVMNLNPFSE